MSGIVIDPDVVNEIAGRILQNRKYRDLELPAETVTDLLRREIRKAKDLKTAEKTVREKLHQIIAPYLGDPDYAEVKKTLADARKNGEASLRSWCLNMLRSHTSSKERIPVLEDFYAQIFERTGTPQSIQDLACAMNPFSFPWMKLLDSTRYFAYDLHSPRIALINAFFEAWGLQQLASVRDILLAVPQEQTDVAFFFKEAHRFEARQKGCCRDFFRQIHTRWLIVTLPAENLTGQHQMRERQRRLIGEAVAGQNWDVLQFDVEKEMVFCIHKNDEEKKQTL